MVGTNLRRAAALVAGMSLGVAACSPGTGDATRQACTWTIGIMGPLEGELAEFGTAPARGVEIAIDLANDGGDLACTLETHSENTDADHKKAPASAQRLVEDEDLVACVCGFATRETRASGDVFEQGGVAMLSISEESRMRDDGFDTWFRLVAPVDRQATAAGLYVKRTFDARRVAIVSTVQSYSDDVVEHVRPVLGRRFAGPLIPFNPETFPEDVARKIRRLSADLVFFAGFSPEAWEVFQAVRAFYDSKVPFVAGGGAIYGPARRMPAGRAHLSCACSDATKIEGAEAFVGEYRARHGTAPPFFAAEGFDGANAVIEALRELTGSESTEEARAHVVDYLDTTEGLEGVVKRYAWDDRGELIPDDGDVWMWAWTRRRGLRMLGSVAELVE